jgi:hypothetical protein
VNFERFCVMVFMDQVHRSLGDFEVFSPWAIAIQAFRLFALPIDSDLVWYGCTNHCPLMSISE